MKNCKENNFLVKEVGTVFIATGNTSIFNPSQLGLRKWANLQFCKELRKTLR